MINIGKEPELALAECIPNETLEKVVLCTINVRDQPMQGDIAFYGPFGTLEAKLWVARSKSNLAIRAANRIFIKILLATGWSLPGFSSSLLLCRHQ